MSLIIDVQGFKTESNQFIPKEIALLDGEGLQTFLIKPPFPFYELSMKEMKQVGWIERNRNIYWKEGFIPFICYKNVIASIAYNRLIYVKGEEKKLWVKEMIDDSCTVVNIEDKNCPNFNILYELYSKCNDIYSCVYHKNVCALKNVICINKWCLDNKNFSNY